MGTQVIIRNADCSHDFGGVVSRVNVIIKNRCRTGKMVWLLKLDDLLLALGLGNSLAFANVATLSTSFWMLGLIQPCSEPEEAAWARTGRRKPRETAEGLEAVRLASMILDGLGVCGGSLAVSQRVAN